jgi:CRP-like cAMP-binding protein
MHDKSNMKAYLEETLRLRIPDDDWNLLLPIITSEDIAKRQHLLEAGKVCRHLWFLRSGTVRSWQNVDGENVTTHFFIAPAMFTAYHSLVSGMPSIVTIESSGQALLDVISHDQLKMLYDRSHTLERIGRLMAEFQFIQEFNRRMVLSQMPALERYEWLEKHHGAVFQHFQLKDIATYLGITPVYLSRLRRHRMSGKQ